MTLGDLEIIVTQEFLCHVAGVEMSTDEPQIGTVFKYRGYVYVLTGHDWETDTWTAQWPD